MATIKEIAALAGCSPSTVSIILRGKAEERNISEKTRDKVMASAVALGYQPNMAARSLRWGMGSDELRIAMFWAQDFRSGMMVRFWDGLRQAIEAQQRSIRLAIIPYTNGHLKDERALTGISDFHAGIICNASGEDLSFMASHSLSLPVVLYNRVCDGYCSVDVDDRRMGELAARALLDAGCREPAILTGPAVFEGMDIRIDGFASAVMAAGCDAPTCHYCDNSIAGGYELARKLLTSDWRKRQPDGIFCGSSMIGHGLLRALSEHADRPWPLPRVVAVGNGIEDQDKYSSPSLSVIRVPMEDMAQACMQLLLDLMQGQVQPGTRLQLDTAFIQRESC